MGARWAVVLLLAEAEQQCPRSAQASLGRGEERLARLTQDGPALLVGFPERNPDPLGNALFNACALLAEGEIRSVNYSPGLPFLDLRGLVSAAEDPKTGEIYALSRVYSTVNRLSVIRDS